SWPALRRSPRPATTRPPAPRHSPRSQVPMQQLPACSSSSKPPCTRPVQRPCHEDSYEFVDERRAATVGRSTIRLANSPNARVETSCACAVADEPPAITMATATILGRVAQRKNVEAE